MDMERFWGIVESACGPDPENWHDHLVDALSRLAPDEILEWDRTFDRLVGQSHRTDLWAAAYLMNGGASDDGFYYFRNWLIGKGRKVYDAAIADPDSLADVTDEDEIAESEIYGAARQAWMNVTGETDDDSYPDMMSGEPDLQGEEWDFDDDDEMRRRLPRLAAKYDSD